MSVAEGQCPSCGAPMTFGVGSSVGQVCKYCKTSVVRSDRGLEDLGKVADLANTPTLIAEGDEGSFEGKDFFVRGRVQLDHGAGPWDEWYVSFRDGTWSWIAYAQGNWYVTSLVENAPTLFDFDALTVEHDVPIGEGETYRVIEKKRGTIVSGEGELPFAVKPGQERFYADIAGKNDGFGTIDFGDRTGPPELFLGKQVPEGALVIRPKSGRPVQEIGVEGIICPSCGGAIPAVAPGRAERLGCPYCGTISEIGSRKILEAQTKARSEPEIPLGTRGTIAEQEYIFCGYVVRSATIEGDHFSWEEYLLFAPGLGFRWIVKDEGKWLWITPVNIAEIDLSAMPRRARWDDRTWTQRNHNLARVDYVLGELYWKVRVGDKVDAMDFVAGTDVLSRERDGDEVAWSWGEPVAYEQLAKAFSLPQRATPTYQATDSDDGLPHVTHSPKAVISIVLILLFIGFLVAVDDCEGCSGTGGGFFHTSGARGGK